MASTYLTRTFSTNSNRKKFTVSVWVKKSQFDSGKVIWGSGDGSGGYVWLVSGSTLYFQQNPSSTIEFNSSARLRDVNGWYHIVQQVDTAQATNTNRMKFWINGEQVTNWVTETYPSQNSDLNFISSSQALQIGMYGNSYWEGSMSHFHWCDGYAYEASDFGQTNATTGEWSINASPSVTYGTNGFFILKDGNSVTDQSGNSNNFTVAGGTLTKTEDNPSNVFATFNPLDINAGTVTTFSNGNTTTMHNAGGNGSVSASRSTLGYSSGKWYWESKCIATGGDVRTGIISMSSSDYVTNTNPYTNNECYNYKQNGNKGSSGSTDVSYGATYTAGDIIGIAHDADNGTLTFYKNGVSQGVAFSGLSTSLTWGAFTTEYNQGKYSHNFGNGYFGTTAVSSAGTNASNNGIFEYDVPTGFTALSTKGFNL